MGTQERQRAQPLVRQTWWTILFGAGLIQSNSEPIRKLLAEFVFRTYYPVGKLGRHSCNSYKLFLVKSLLPYAMQGNLFNKSIQRSGKIIVSTHGEGLAQFCATLTLFESNQIPGTYSGTILKYLVDNANTLNPHATGYVLQGLDRNRTWEVALEDAELAVDLPFKTAFSQIQRVVMLRHCISIASRLKVVQNDAPDNYAKRRLHLQNRLTTLHCAMKEESRLYLNMPLQKREDDLVLSKDPQHWVDAHFSKWIELVDGATLQAQWAETPKQFLGAQTLCHIAKYAVSQSDLKDYVAEYAEKLFALVQGKTFLWKPLAQALRDAYFHFPDHFLHSGNPEVDSIVKCVPIVDPNLLEHPQIEDVILEFINNPPLPRPEFLLDAAIANRELDNDGHNLLNVFADETLGHACIYDMLNRLRRGHTPWGLRLLDRILEPWLEQEEPVPMVAKWKRTAQVQAMIILLEQCILKLEDAHLYWDKVFTVLALEPHPRFRFLLEWALVSHSQRVTILVHFMSVEANSSTTVNVGLQTTISRLQAADHSNPKNVSSLIKVAMQLALHPPRHSVPIPHEDLEKDNLSLLTELIALSASPKIPIRHEAQWSFPILFGHAEQKKQKSIIENPAFVAMNKFIKTLDKYNTPPEAKILSSFDAEKDVDLETLFEGGYLRINPSELPLIHVTEFEEVWAHDTPETVAHIVPPCFYLGKGKEEWYYETNMLVPIEERKIHHTPKATVVNKQKNADAAATPQIENPTHRVAPLQTKSLTLDSTFTSLNIDSTTERATTNGPTLIASLIAFPHNLGGLSRASEIFGCTSLLIPDIAVLKNQQFRNVSVNSELHVNIEELKEKDLGGWLRGKKGEGWIIVGVEQTDNSIIIGMPQTVETSGNATVSTKEAEEDQSQRQVSAEKPPSLPKKSIIVMGAEKTGIPAEILVECDVCVEIKQWGVTRSLNVQTAAACVLFEWRRIWGDGR
jgi:tRNA guanosine-2'-O-methyltransferase